MRMSAHILLGNLPTCKKHLSVKFLLLWASPPADPYAFRNSNLKVVVCSRWPYTLMRMSAHILVGNLPTCKKHLSVKFLLR